MAEVRSLLSRLSVERHTSHRHPMTGTPCEVPVPKKVTFMGTKLQFFPPIEHRAGEKSGRSHVGSAPEQLL